MKKIAILSFGALGLSMNAVEADDSKLITAKEQIPNQTVQGKNVYTVDSLHLPENTHLVFNEPSTLYVNDLNLENGSLIQTNGNNVEIYVANTLTATGAMIDASTNSVDTSGANGASGVDGNKAADALAGGAGASGGNAANGVSGGSASSIHILTPYLQGNLQVISRGGNGGNGGSGGNGGNGGAGLSGADARVLYHFKGLDNLPTTSLLQLGTTIGIPYVGQVLAILAIFNNMTIGDGFDGFDGGRGGNGGNAGAGGSGGNGGDIEVTYGVQVNGNKVIADTSGGSGGAAGKPGNGGIGGTGGAGGTKGDLWSRDGKPGKAGAPGTNGLTANPGAPGKSGQFNLVETDDPNWIGCYVRYRSIVDNGGDSNVANQVLLSCSSS